MPVAVAYRRADAIGVIGALCERALASYGPIILDNVDLSRLPDELSRANVVARALISRGDAQAFRLGREILAHTNHP